MLKKEIEKFKFIKKKPYTVDDNFAELFWENARELSRQFERRHRVEVERSWEENRRRSNYFLNNNFNGDQLRWGK